jgi:hypothetical protein
MRVGLSVVSDDATVIAAAAERFAAVAAGFALEKGAESFLMIGPDSDAD